MMVNRRTFWRNLEGWGPALIAALGLGFFSRRPCFLLYVFGRHEYEKYCFIAIFRLNLVKVRNKQINYIKVLWFCSAVSSCQYSEKPCMSSEGTRTRHLLNASQAL